MATRHSTGSVPAFLLSKPVSPSIPVRPTVIRGELYFAVGDVAFADFRHAACAWSAAECHRVDIAEPIDTLIIQRTEALAAMRQAGDDLAAFSAASKRESALSAAMIRQRKLEHGTPRERIRTWCDEKLRVTLQFFESPKLAPFYTGLLAELRQEIARRRGSSKLEVGHG